MFGEPGLRKGQVVLNNLCTPMKFDRYAYTCMMCIGMKFVMNASFLSVLCSHNRHGIQIDRRIIRSVINY